MFSNNTTVKKYYTTITTINIGTGTGTSVGTLSPVSLLFIAKANIILNYYNSSNLLAFNSEIINFNNLKSLYPDYIYDSLLVLITNFINIIETLFNINIDLLEQKTILEKELLVVHNLFYNISIDSYNLVQNTSLDLVYLQYLLMFNLNDSNGIFIPSKLETAKQVLISNNYVLVNLLT